MFLGMLRTTGAEEAKAAIFRLATNPVAIAVVVFLLGSFLAVKPVFDYDMFWHIANGREMMTLGKVVEHEAFSYTHPGEPFNNHWWLAQLIWYWIWVAFGADGLFVLKVLVSGGVSLLAYQSARFLGAGVWLSAAGGVLSVLVGFYRYLERPELFSLLLLAVLGCLLAGWRAGRNPMVMLLPIPLIMVVWDWLHGAVYGLLYLLIFVGSTNVSRYFRWPESGQADSSLRWLNGVLFVTLLCMTLNPWGLLTYGDYVILASSEARAAFKSVQEYATSTLDNNTKAFLLFGATALSFLAGLRFVGITGPLLVLAFALLAWEYARVTGAFAIVTLPFLAAALSRLVADNRSWARWGARVVLLLGLALSGKAYVDIKTVHPGNISALGWGFDPQYFPVGAVEFAKYYRLSGNLYNTGHFGGYLAYNLYPEARIFQYNYPKIFGDSYRFLKGSGADIARWNVNYAFVGLPPELDRHFPDKDWARVYRESAGVLVLRRSAENAELIRRHEVRVFHPRLPMARLMAIVAQPADRQRAVDEAVAYLAFQQDNTIAAWLNKVANSDPGLVVSESHRDLLAKASVFNPGLRLR